MGPLESCSKENKGLAWKHLEADKPKTAVTTIISTAQTVLLNLSLWFHNLGKDLKPIDVTLDNAPSHGQDTDEILVPKKPIPPNITPSSREIPKAWKDYSEKWFYSYPFGNDS